MEIERFAHCSCQTQKIHTIKNTLSRDNANGIHFSGVSYDQMIGKIPKNSYRWN